jgi:hypothetical protein
MDKDDESRIRRELDELRQKHRDLDATINALSDAGRTDPVQLQLLKKRKLALKDRIALLEDRLLPDIIA